MVKTTYVVSDVHGDHDALRKALYGAGLFDNHGLKDPDAFIVQIGDLANCVADSREGDLQCLEEVGTKIDLMLIGNHEMPYFDSQNRFAGFYKDHEISYCLHEMSDHGFIKPSYLHNGTTLVTHAGLAPQQFAAWGKNRSVQKIHDKLMFEWADGNYGHYLFSDVGKARYGPDKIGGILWCDFDQEFTPTEFPQIVGHTPGVLRRKGNALCIDTIRSTGLPTVIKLEE